jgi:hypothetical protein
MRHRIALALAALLALPAALHAQTLRCSFTGKPGDARYALARAGQEPGPALRDGALRLLDDEQDLGNSAAFPAAARGLRREVDITFRMRLLYGGGGLTAALLDTAKYGTEGEAPRDVVWDDPRLPQAFAVCFDVYNPPSSDPFNAQGNIYNRPQREVALTWDGLEIVKRVSPVEFRGEQWHTVRIQLRFVCGGAEAGVSIDNQPVFNHFFIAGMEPFTSRLALGACTGKITNTADVSDLRADWRGSMKPPAAPVVVTAIDKVAINSGHTSEAAEAQFPEGRFGRIIGTLTLAEPPGGYDPWDRSASVAVFDDKGERFELIRFITPYRKGHTWRVDLTDYRPLLTGRKKVLLECGTYGTGWLITVQFTFYSGKPADSAFEVRKLWVGSPEVGNPDKPVSDFYQPITVPIPKAASRARLRITVTGHGMSPNSRNAAEFMPIGRTVTVGSKSYHNRLWKTDNYLNPVRPQGGTWKYDRAGWAPGDVVRPWEIDITEAVRRGEPATLRYDLDPYVNEDRGKTWAPFHMTEAHLILYRR